MLIGDNCEPVTLPGQPQDSQQEILAVGREDPAGAKDQIRSANGGDRLLARQLGAAIDIQRPGWIVFNPRARLGAIEDIIRRVVNEQASVAGGFLGERRGARCVDQCCQLRLRFSLVDGRCMRRHSG